MPLIARQRSRFAVLAVLALVGSLLAVSAVPAVAAADGKASAKARFSACVAAATEDAGFTDIDGNFGQDAANCLAHYGITEGTSEGVFSPSDSITRLQMALFLTRAAGPAGIEMDDPEDQGFSDISGLTDEIQNAINQAAAAGIMTGDGATFDPTGGVSRKDMAVFLDAFLAAVGIELDRRAVDPYDIDEDDIDTPFNDVSRVSFSAYGAINRLYELGVASGTGDGTTFSPDALLSRAQMAVFIARALGHTNARPAGLSVQVDPTSAYRDQTPTIEASLRDSNHDPIPDELVEVFAAQSHVEAFNDEGECSADLKDVALGSIGATRCEIDAADEATEPDGNVLLEIDATDFCLVDTTLWAWTGDIGDEFSADDTIFASAKITVSLTPDDVTVESDMADNARFLQMGDTATFAIQVVDTAGEPVALEGLVLVVNTVSRLNSRTQNVTDEYRTDAHGRAEVSFTHDDPRPGDERQGDDAAVTVTVKEVFDADGETVYTRIDNKRDQTPSGMDTVDWSDRDSLPWALSISQSVKYHEASDEGSGVRHTVRAELVDQYGDPVSGAKIRFWSNARNDDDDTNPVPVTYNNGLGGLDRYEYVDGGPDVDMIEADNDIDTGDPKTTAGVANASGDPDVRDYADERTTNRRGIATKSYSRDAGGAYVETISVAFNHNPDDGNVDTMDDDPVNNPDFLDMGGTDDIREVTEMVSYDPYWVPNPTSIPDLEFSERELDLMKTEVHYWATEADDQSVGTTALTAVVVSTDTNSVVVTDNVDGEEVAPDDMVLIVTYDSNDQFNVSNATGAARVTMSYFESVLTADGSDNDDTTDEFASMLTFDLEEDPEEEVNTFTITNGRLPTTPGPCVIEE